jgi:hypothetical protein
MPEGPPGDDAADGDKDAGIADDNQIVFFGHAAGASEANAIAGLVQSYYRAAAAGDGLAVCSRLYGPVAESLPEELSSPSPSQGSLTECASAMDRELAELHSKLVAEAKALQVTRVRVRGTRGIAMVYLGAKPESWVTLRREGGGVWKLQFLFAVGLP